MSTIIPYSAISLKEAKKLKLHPLYGPCNKDEYHLLDRAVKQLTKGGNSIVWEYVNETSDVTQVSLWRKTGAV